MRNYGLPESTPITTPKAKPSDVVCPNCGCKAMEVSLKVEQKLLVGGRGEGVYFGCPACPWASPMVVTSEKK